MRYFDAEALEFLGDLRRHNDRTWFNEHKERYERALREPFLEFIADAGPELRTISRNLVADPRPSGGSLFRIHRDVRFSKQNRPSKRHSALRPRGGSPNDGTERRMSSCVTGITQPCASAVLPDHVALVGVGQGAVVGCTVRHRSEVRDDEVRR